MSTTIDTFIYLKRDIEQTFQRVQTIYNSSHYNPYEFNQLLNHISCTLDDLQKVNQILYSSSNQSVNISLNENNFQEDKELLLSYNSNMTNTTINHPLTSNEREDFIHRMKTQYNFYKNKIQSIKKETQMEIIHLDQPLEDEEEERNEDKIICKQDEQLEDIHHSIISLKNLTQNINFEINDHIRVLDNLETNMINSQNRVENLTNRTKNFLQISSNGVGGHTCLFSIAIGLFFLIIILILFF